MLKTKSNYSCIDCGYESPKWLGKCPSCSQWNSFQEEHEAYSKKNYSKDVSFRYSGPKNISEIEEELAPRLKTELKEFDRVLGGGLTIGSLILIGGEPGIGKSTLLMEVCGKISKLIGEEKVLYISGEESQSQIANRSKRLGIKSQNLFVLNETCWEKILDHLKNLKPKFIVLDSIQTIYSSQLESTAGNVGQIKEVTFELMNFAKGHNLTCFIIGHVTKDGHIAGPKTLEHMVDTVIYFEGDQQGQYRLLRVIKNRFGNTNEIGLFEMKENGLVEIQNATQYFIDQTLTGSVGRSITCFLEGTRSLFVEIQALVIENKFAVGRRTTQGVDANRVSLLIAVIDKYLNIAISFNDIYVNVAGGIKLQSRDNDLSIMASLLSSYFGKPLPSDTVFLGEIGLSGEVRPLLLVESRLKEIAQMNYKKVVLHQKTAKDYLNKFTLELIGISKAEELRNLYFNE